MSEKKRDWGIFIDDILGSTEKIDRYTEGKTLEEFSHGYRGHTIAERYARTI